MVHISQRGQVTPFYAMDVLAAATKRRAAGHDVVFMTVGQPAAPAPLRAREAAKRALDGGEIGYTDALGLPALRQAIADHYQELYGVEVDPQRVAVTTGSSAGFNLAFLSYFSAGDRVAITRPGYPAYRNILGALGLEVVEIACNDPKAPWLTAEALEQAHREAPLKGVLFASPSNPTGTVMGAQQLQEVIECADRLGIHVISDEIYHRLSYDKPDITALQFSDNVTVINSFSKYYCMTGWRIGWMILPPKVDRAVECLTQSLYISAPYLSQVAAIEALRATTELEEVKQGYLRNRTLLLEKMPQLGFTLEAPADGAFYLYCNVTKFSNDSMDFARKMLQEVDIAATPGIDFDPIDGHKTMRFSYAGDYTSMQTAMQRLETWLS